MTMKKSTMMPLQRFGDILVQKFINRLLGLPNILTVYQFALELVAT